MANRQHQQEKDSILLKQTPLRAGGINYISGVVGGVAVVCVGHPFDTIKTRQQTAPPHFYKNTLDCVKKTMKREGIQGFYVGIMSPLVGQMFFRAVSFMTFYGTLRAVSTMRNENTKPSTSSTFIAGSMTGFAISFIETPIDLVKTKLQIQIFRNKKGIGSGHLSIPRYSNMYNCVTYIAKTHGIRALWQGLNATIIRNIPANALFFPINELVKIKFANDLNCNVRDIPMSRKLIAGSCAGLSYWALTYPLDAIKARVMATSYTTHSHRDHSYMSIVRNMSMHPSEFFVGFMPCVLRASVACSAMFWAVDTTRNYLEKNI